MPRIRNPETPESITVFYLYRGKKTEIAKKTGMNRRTIWNRENLDPGKTTLREFGRMAEDLTDEAILKIVRAWS